MSCLSFSNDLEFLLLEVINRFDLIEDLELGSDLLHRVMKGEMSVKLVAGGGTADGVRLIFNLRSFIIFTWMGFGSHFYLIVQLKCINIVLIKNNNKNIK